MPHIPKRRFKAINIIFTIIMGFGSMSYGYSAIVISTTLAQPSFIAYMGLDKRGNASELIGLTGSLFQVGGFIGTFFVSFFADRWGRRVGIAFPAALIVVSNALLAGSVNIDMFIAFRLFAGAGACMIASAVPLWMSEVVPANVRGTFVNINGASILFGGVLAAWIGYGFSKYQPDDLSTKQWRATLAFGCLPPAILLCCLYWMPESPRWLLRNGREAEAEKVLRRLDTPEEAAYELLQIRAQTRLDENRESSYLSLITKSSYRKRTILGMLTTISTQLTGPLVIVNYGPIIFASLGFDTNTQLIYQGGWILVAFGGGLFSLIIVDLVSRPKLLAGGILGSLVMLAIEAALVATYATSPESLASPNTSALQAAVAMFYIYIFIFEMTLDGGQFVYLSEIFPTHLRAKGISLGIAALCAINVVWLQAAPTAFENIGWKFYLCFIVSGTIMALAILFWWPDTKQMPLEEIAALFGDDVEYVVEPCQSQAVVSVHEATGGLEEKDNGKASTTLDI